MSATSLFILPYWLVIDSGAISMYLILSLTNTMSLCEIYCFVHSSVTLLLIWILTSCASPSWNDRSVSLSFLIWKLWLPICVIFVNQTSVQCFVHGCTCWPLGDLQNKQWGGKLQEAIYSPKATLEWQSLSGLCLSVHFLIKCALDLASYVWFSFFLTAPTVLHRQRGGEISPFQMDCNFPPFSTWR